MLEQLKWVFENFLEMYFWVLNERWKTDTTDVLAIEEKIIRAKYNLSPSDQFYDEWSANPQDMLRPHKLRRELRQEFKYVYSASISTDLYLDKWSNKSIRLYVKFLESKSADYKGVLLAQELDIL